jgi:type I restriction enzyme S subunit
VTAPKAWPLVPLGSVVEFLDHLRKPVTASDRVDGPYPYYGANGQQGNIDGYIFDEPLLLLAEDGGHFDNPARGIAYRISGKSWVNNHAHVLRMKPDLDLDYAAAALANMDVRKYITGTTRSKLTKAGAARIEIPLPPLDEQRRIAAILDQADDIRTSRVQVITMLSSLRQSIFIDMFGAPDRLNAQWECAPLGDLADTCSGGTPNRSNDSYYGGDIPWVKSGEVDQGLVVSTEETITQTGLANSSAKVMPPGTVLVAMYGATAGKVGVLGIAAATNQAVCSITPGDRLIGAYLVEVLRSMNNHLLTKRAGGAQPNLSQGVIRGLTIPVPPAAVQDQFRRRLHEVDAAEARAIEALDRQSDLFLALQAQAFAGAL